VQSARSSITRWLLLGCGGIVLLLVLAGGTLGGLWAFGVFGKSSSKGSESKARAQLVGQWEHTSSKDSAIGMALDIHDDGNLSLTGIKNGQTQLTIYATWEVLSEKTDRITLKVKWSTQPEPTEWDVEFLPGESMRVNFKSSSNPPVTYKRRR
jgi:hypothetical protein